MAKKVTEITIGIDVSKSSLDLYWDGCERSLSIHNQPDVIEDWLSQWGAAALAVEATGVYHEAVVEIAVKLGLVVYLVDGLRLHRYREAVGVRAKTDRDDAQLLHRYLRSERANLRPVRVLDERVKALWRLLKRRAKMVQVRTMVRSTLKGINGLGALDTDQQAVMKSIGRLLRGLERRAAALARELGWTDALQRLRTIPGVGPLSALALRSLYERGEFSRADKFIAFLGLDVRVRDSGTHRGRRKLTKHGDSEIRRLLFNGARSAANNDAHWAQLKAYYQERGRSEIETSVILARKMARIGYAVIRDETSYQAPHTPVQA